MTDIEINHPGLGCAAWIVGFCAVLGGGMAWATLHVLGVLH